jgi:hypothetical protein
MELARHALALLVIPAAALAAHATTARGDKAPKAAAHPAPISIELPADTCSSAAAGLRTLGKNLSAAFVKGDEALAKATAFAASGAITTEDSDALYESTKELEDGLEAATKNIQELDALIPSGNDTEHQLVHLKISLPSESLRNFARATVMRMMATVNCEMNNTFSVCQARVLTPLYLFEKDGAKKQPYADFKTDAERQYASLKEFFAKTLCSKSLKEADLALPAADGCD